MHKTQKAAGQSVRRLTDSLTRPVGTGETMRNTGDAQRRLHLVSETRRNAADGETHVVWLMTQRPVDPLQRRGARDEDTTVLPARLTLPPLVELLLVVRCACDVLSRGAVAVGGPLVVLDRGGQGRQQRPRRDPGGDGRPGCAFRIAVVVDGQVASPPMTARLRTRAGGA
jgi:hypothetical protein